jgi:Family of unknown function (DUF6228)
MLVIHSNVEGGRVEVQGNHVHLWRREVQANVLVDEHETGETMRGLSILFESLAKDWRGWEGRRGWGSIEGEFKLYAAHDGLGTVELMVTLAQRDPAAGTTWNASASLLLDAGGLGDIAREAVKLAG